MTIALRLTGARTTGKSKAKTHGQSGPVVNPGPYDGIYASEKTWPRG